MGYLFRHRGPPGVRHGMHSLCWRRRPGVFASPEEFQEATAAIDCPHRGLGPHRSTLPSPHSFGRLPLQAPSFWTGVVRTRLCAGECVLGIRHRCRRVMAGPRVSRRGPPQTDNHGAATGTHRGGLPGTGPVRRTGPERGGSKRGRHRHRRVRDRRPRDRAVGFCGHRWTAHRHRPVRQDENSRHDASCSAAAACSPNQARRRPRTTALGYQPCHAPCPR